MKKQQSRFALFLLIIAAAGIVILVVGIIGLQNLTTQKDAKTRELKAKSAECKKISADLSKAEDWKQQLDDLNAKLSTLDKSLVDYEYIPTYLAQIQRTATETGNNIRSIRPRSIEPLDSNSPLIMASYERWLEKNPDIAAAAQEQSGDAADKKDVKPAKESKSKRDKKPSEYRIQQFTLEIEGNYTSVVRLLDALRSFPKLIYIHSVAVTPNTRNDSANLKAMLETYAIIPPNHYRPETKPVAAAPAEGKLP